MLNTAVSIAFPVIHEGDAPTPGQIRHAIWQYLAKTDEEIAENAEFFDTIEEEDDAIPVVGPGDVGADDLELRNALSAALGWPDGLAADIKPWSELLRLVAAQRIQSTTLVDRIKTALLRDCEQMLNWDEGDAERHLPRTAVLLGLGD